MWLRRLRHGGTLVDSALVLRFPEGRSFTGEVVVEFQLHGSPAVVRKVIDVLGTLPGFRPAEAGEFTRRALDHGRMSLTEVEGLADLLAAETEAQRVQAARIFEGALERRVEGWRKDLMRMLALVEADIDFADEKLPDDLLSGLADDCDGLVADMREELAGVSAAERIRDGFEVAIVGAPNVGKSTLLNRIARREAALTSEVAGTTRDVIEVRFDLGGLPVTFLDTAGLRESEDVVERMGIGRAIVRARAADLRVFLGPVGADLEPQPGDLLVGEKADLNAGATGLAVSGATGEGVDVLLERIREVLSGRSLGAGLIVRARQAQALETCVACLDESRDLVQMGGQEELIADRLHAAARSLEVLVGRIGVEDVLGEIFSTFCIGK